MDTCVFGRERQGMGLHIFKYDWKKENISVERNRDNWYVWVDTEHRVNKCCMSLVSKNNLFLAGKTHYTTTQEYKL